MSKDQDLPRTANSAGVWSEIYHADLPPHEQTARDSDGVTRSLLFIIVNLRGGLVQDVVAEYTEELALQRAKKFVDTEPLDEVDDDVLVYKSLPDRLCSGGLQFECIYSSAGDD